MANSGDDGPEVTFTPLRFVRRGVSSMTGIDVECPTVGVVIGHGPVSREIAFVGFTEERPPLPRRPVDGYFGPSNSVRQRPESRSGNEKKADGRNQASGDGQRMRILLSEFPENDESEPHAGAKGDDD